MNKKKIKIALIILLSIFCLGQGHAAGLNKKEEDAFYVAVKSYEDGFYDISLTLFDRFLKTYGSSEKKLDALVYIGQCYFFQEKYLKALDQFEPLLKMEGAERIRDKVLFWLGEVYAKGHDYKQAAQYDQELIKNYKDSYYFLSAYKSLASVQYKDGKFKESLETYRQIGLQFRNSPAAEEAFFGVCESLYSLRDYSGLKKELSDFIKQYSNSLLVGRAYFYLGEADFYLGEYEDAIDAYGKTVRSSSEEAQNNLALLGMGWSYLKLKKYEEASDVFSKFPEEDQPLAVILGRAVMKSGLGEYEKSLELFEKVIAADREDEYAPFAYFGKAEALYNLSRFQEAMIAYRVCLDKLKENSGVYAETKDLKDKIYYGLAWSCLKIGDFRSAQDMFQKTAAVSSDKIVKLSALVQLADTYQDVRDYKKAVEAYQNFLNDYPDSVYNDYIQYQLAMAWLKMENLDSAILAFRKLLKDFSSSKLIDGAHYFLGVAYFQKGDFQAAKLELNLFDAEFKSSPYRAQALFLLGETLSNLSEYKAAIGVFSVIIKEFSSQETLRQKAEYEVANAYAASGNEPESNKRLSDFIRRYPDSQLSPDIIYWLGESYFEKKNYSSARKYFERLIRNYPDHEFIADAYLHIGLSYLQEGDQEIARRNLEQAREHAKGAIQAKAGLLIGDLYLSGSDDANALKNYEEVAALGGEWAKSAYVKMASVYARKKSFQEAVSFYEKALALEGAEANSGIQFNIAELLEEKGQTQEALEAYLKVSYLYPREEAMTARALLRVARIYENKGNWPELKNILIKISRLNVPEAKYAKEKLATLTQTGARHGE